MLSQLFGGGLLAGGCSALCFITLCPNKSTFPFITPAEQMVHVLFSQESLEALCAITGVENYLRHLIKKKKKERNEQTAKPLMNVCFAC